MYITICERISSPGWMHETGCSGLVHWDDPEGWDGEGGGRGVQDGEHPWLSHVNVWQKPAQYCKVICLQLKQKNLFNLKKKALKAVCGIKWACSQCWVPVLIHTVWPE